MQDEIERESGKQRRPRSVSSSGGLIGGLFGKRRDSKGKSPTSSPNTSRREDVDESYELQSPLNQPLLAVSASALTSSLSNKHQSDGPKPTKSGKKGWRARSKKRDSMLVTYSQLEQMRHKQRSPLHIVNTNDYYTQSHLPQRRDSSGGGGGETIDLVQSDVVNPELKTIEHKLDRLTNKMDYLATHIIQTSQAAVENKRALDNIVVDYGDDMSGWCSCCGF
jgi:hypothetical protein